jgi:diguanylate cyclase (GGDEF)-like protein
MTIVETMLLAGAYALSRTPYSSASAVLTVVIILIAIFAAILIGPQIVVVLAMPVIAIIVGGLFLSPGNTVLVIAVTMIAVGLAPVTSGYPPIERQASMFILLTVGVVVLLGAIMHRQDFEQMTLQSDALVEKDARVQVAVQAARDTNEKLEVWAETLERRNAEVTQLSRMTELLQSSQSLDEAYAIIGQHARRLFPATSGVLYLFDASQDQFQAASVWGEASVPLRESNFAAKDCWALRVGRLHLVQDQNGEPTCRHVEVSDRAAFPSICIPIMARGEALGVLHLETDEVSMQFTEAQQRLSQAVADTLSLTLANFKLRETLRHQSIRDPLTGLFNRRFLEVSLGRELKRAARNQSALSVVMFDIDHFKDFNDIFGHEGGDLVLHALGDYLAEHIRGSDIACRYGGEEFVLILPDAPLDAGRGKAEKIREDIAAFRLSYQGRSLGPITISLGVSAFPEHGLDGDALLHLADAAMYRAKEEGRNRTTTAPS